MAEAKEIWDTLSAIDVSDHIEKKGNLSYLSWAWAWGVLMQHYPQANYHFEENEVLPDGSVTVYVSMEIDGVQRTMHLPVMDNRNNSIFGPSSRQISDSRMRCLVKCIAMYGLGHYIYAGEDIPQPAAPGQEQPQGRPERVAPGEPVTPPVEIPDPPQEPAGQPQQPPPQGAPQPIPPGDSRPSPPTENRIETAQAAKETRGMLVQMASSFCAGPEELRNFWMKNRALVEVLRNQYPDEYSLLRDEFQAINARLAQQGEPQ